MRYLLPLGVFIVVAGFLFYGLNLNPREVPSPLVGKPAPTFALARLDQPTEKFAPKEMAGKVWLLNVWASWCVSCRAEHPVLVELSKQKIVPVVGLNYKDQPDDAKKWLQHFGDPYLLSISDIDGRVGIDFGVYGVPETFVIDQKGIIRYKHIGPVTADSLKEKILPLVERLARG
ncbi:MAG TPA: DsbE family thiol:disulfide interchange protein [Burkholderiales bacterium]